MSLILDALKKSEAERQRGQAPGLFVEQAPLVRARREGTPAWAYALAALLLVVLAVFGWREWSRGQAAPAEAEVVVAPPSPTDTGASPPTTAAPVPAAAVEAPAGEPVSARAAPSVATPAPRPAPASPRASEPPPAASARGSDVVVAPAGASGADATAAPAGREAGEPPLPRLADLGAGERAALPPLKLTMHVFADDAPARFVILDGRRLGEGAMVAEGIVLREIRRDGIVLEASGRVLLVPRP